MPQIMPANQTMREEWNGSLKSMEEISLQ